VAWIFGALLLVAVVAALLEAGTATTAPSERVGNWISSGAAEMAFSDWLKVLIVPLVLAVGAILFNRSLKMHELNIADQRAQDEALRSYLEHMATMLMEKELRHKGEDDEESICARASTLLALRRLHPERKRNLLLFLCESGLIRKLPPEIREYPTPVLDLYGADLRGIDLRGCRLPDVVLADADLSGANLRDTGLRGANLKGANLEGANLKDADLSPAGGTHTDLSDANLSGVNLKNANLEGVNLRHALVTDKQLAAAKSLRDAIMPDGSKRSRR